MRVLGLGDNIFDVYERLGVAYPGGNAANVAVNARKLGHEAAYLGIIADDAWGEVMRASLRSERVETERCPAEPASTTKRCLQDRIDGERRFLRLELGDAWCAFPHLTPDLVDYIGGFDVVLTSCNAKCAEQLGALDGRGGILSFDFGEKAKYRTREYLDSVVPHVDLVQFSCADATEEEVDRLLGSYDFTCPVLVTRGGLPPILTWKGGSAYGSVVGVGPVVDTMGAGDAFATALVCGLVGRGWRRGGPFPGTEEVESALGDAAAHAARMCQVEGAFGHPLRLRNLRAVIFDLDGVLVESEPHYVSLMEGLASEHGASLTQEQIDGIYGSSDESQARLMGDAIGCSPDHASKLIAEYFDARPFNYGDLMIDGVPELVGWLRSQGFACAIASSSSLADIQRAVRQCGLEGMFDLLVSGTQFEQTKPDPAVYLYAMRELGVRPDQTIVVEDSGYGIQAGVAAGADVLALRKPHGNICTNGALLEFDDHEQILNYLKAVHEVG